MAQAAEWDFYTPEVNRDPQPLLKEMRRRGHATWHEAYQMWVVGRYSDITAICRDEKNFTARDGIVAHNFGVNSVLAQDGSIHRRLRSVWAAPFMPTALKALTGRVTEISTGLLKPVAAAIEAGEAADIAPVNRALPVEVVRELLGVPEEYAHDFARWSDEITQMTGFALPPDHPVEIRRAEAQAAVAELFKSEIAKRRVKMQEDLIGRIVASGIDADLGDQALIDNCRLLLVAGNETTSNLIGNTICVLDRFPEAQAEVRQDRELIPAALEEVLRYEGVAHFGFRRAKSDNAKIGDVHIPKGDQICLVYGAANRDEAQFPDGDKFDIHRKMDQHVGFGHSIHTCMGNNLARLQARIYINTLFDLVPAYKVIETDYGITFPLRGPVRLLIGKP